MPRIPSALGIIPLGLALVLSSCGSPAQESASPSSSASSSQSSTTTSSAQPSSAISQTAQGSSAAASNSDSPAASSSASASLSSPPDSYEGAEDLKNSGRTITVDAPEVKKNTELVNSYEKSLSEVKAQPAASASPSEATEEGQPGERSSVALDQGTIDAIAAMSTGAAQEEFTMSALEYLQNGWRYEGQSTVVGTPRIAETTYEGKPAQLLEVCMDSSKVVLKDSTGAVIDTSGSPKRSLNIYTLVTENGVTKIARHDFPNNPDC